MKKNIIITILIVILVAISTREISTINRSDKTSYYQWGMKTRMIKDFENFGEELQLFNDKLSTILKQDESYSYNDFQYFISDIAIDHFFSSNFFSSSIMESSGLYDYEKIYIYANKNINTILVDNEITTAELKYLQNFSEFNKELIREWENIMLDLFPNEISRSSEEYDNAQLKIESIYNDFSEKADELVSSEFLELHGLLRLKHSD